MGKRLPHTPSSQIRTALRRMWLRSRERAAAIKRDKYSCCTCGAKQSKAKGREVAIEVHHTAGNANLAEIEATIRMFLLVHHDYLKTLCKKCHKDEHNAVKS
jgi:5-methylcytosine-specific restriction endonuclease McrA